jgi:hypothetical protein
MIDIVPEALSAEEIEGFVTNGFVKVVDAFPTELADACRAILWRDLGCDPDDASTWTRPVVRLGLYGDEPFVQAANTPRLHRAFDQLVGSGRWLPRTNLGTFPVRFPSSNDPGDTGWHIDVSFGTALDFFDWRANVSSRGRALLMLFLFSSVGEGDSPTRIRAGSHFDIARRLAPAGENGFSLRELAANGFAESDGRPEVLATGMAGTVYLCHPFLVHAAQPHAGARPRFLAQPPLLPVDPDNRPRGDVSPVERATARALEGSV